MTQKERDCQTSQRLNMASDCKRLAASVHRGRGGGIREHPGAHLGGCRGGGGIRERTTTRACGGGHEHPILAAAPPCGAPSQTRMKELFCSSMSHCDTAAPRPVTPASLPLNK